MGTCLSGMSTSGDMRVRIPCWSSFQGLVYMLLRLTQSRAYMVYSYISASVMAKLPGPCAEQSLRATVSH